MPASHGRAKITQEAIAGIALGHPQSYYKTKLGGYRPSIALGPNYPSLAFGQPEIAVYFPTQKKPARVITTWNPGYRTAEGIGPCSTLAQMNKAYGKRIQPSPHGTSPNGKVHWAWTLGRNLEFVTQDRKTISSVVLYRGSGGWATYLGANETPCK
jgi:hypothetical protein